MTAGLPPSIHTIIDLALEEDLGRGDITTRLSVPSNIQGTGRVVARQQLVTSGLDIFAAVMKRVDNSISISQLCNDGESVSNDTKVIETSGPVDSLLMGERVALNFLQRLCGVATITRRFVDALDKNSKTRLVDTRKTTPGMRFLERRAVIHGGAYNHRVDLSGGILIKENHITAAGSINAAIKNCRQLAPHPLKIEVEVQNEQELKLALDEGADIILLDNMTVEQLTKCVEITDGKAVLEASGGVNLQTVTPISKTGVDVISVGALTHSAPSADLSFLIDCV